MKDIEKTAGLLEQKQQLFTLYYKATTALLEQTTDTAIGKYITERETLANKIDKLDRQIAEELAPWGETARKLTSGHATIEELPAELQPLHGVCSEIMDTVRRIRLLNTEATSLCEQLKDGYEHKIKEASNLPKINRYLNSLSGPGGGNNFGTV